MIGSTGEPLELGAAVYRLLQQGAGSDPYPLSELIGGTGNDWDEFTND